LLTRFNELTPDSQAAFLLALSGKIVNMISTSTGYDKAVAALEECWDWVETKNVSGDKLYEFLDTVDETGLFVLMQLEKDEKTDGMELCRKRNFIYCLESL